MAGLIDAHVHVWTPDTAHYPLAAGFKKEDMKPASFTPEELFKHTKPAGVDRINLIQMSFYGFDNSYMLDMMKLHEGVFSGTAVIDPLAKEPERQMGDSAKKGVRAFRIHPKLSKETPEKWLRPARLRQHVRRRRQEQPGVELSHRPRWPAGTGPHVFGPQGHANHHRPPLPHRRRRNDPRQGRGRAVCDGETQESNAQSRRLLRAGQEEAALRRSGSAHQARRQGVRSGALYVGERLSVSGAGRAHLCGQHRPGAQRLDFLSNDDKEWLLRKTAEKFFFGK